MSTETNTIQMIQLIAGNLGLPGAPVLQLDLLYNPEEGNLNGQAIISQTVVPPYGRVVVRHVTGDAHGLGLGGATRAIAVRGEYVQSFPPPAIGSYLAQFSATFVTDNNWKGHGSFEFGNQKVMNVPVGPQG
ncbi:MAG: DUF1842 domain-containing protein [Massilia sp.]